MRNYDDIYFQSFCDGLKPDPNFTVSSWADNHRILSSISSAEPGPWRTDRTPYLKEIMDCLSPSNPCEKVVFMKGAQIGGTECGNNWMGFVIHHAPGPMLIVNPTVETAKRTSKMRIDPAIENCPALKEKVSDPRARDSGNTILMKEFPGGVLVMTGANSAVGLRSMPIRYLFLDEVDGYPDDANSEGDPVNLGKAERVIRTIMEMWHQKTEFTSRDHRNQELIRFINYYNTIKPHKGIEDKTPYEKLVEYFENEDRKQPNHHSVNSRLNFLGM